MVDANRFKYKSKTGFLVVNCAYSDGVDDGTGTGDCVVVFVVVGE